MRRRPCIYIYIYTYVCICVYIYIYIYIYISQPEAMDSYGHAAGGDGGPRRTPSERLTHRPAVEQSASGPLS